MKLNSYHNLVPAFLGLVNLVTALTCSGADTNLCKKQTPGMNAEKQSVTICTELYFERPYVRPPEDLVAGASFKGYLTLEDGFGQRWIDRRGNAYRLVDSSGSQTANYQVLTKDINLPSYRYLFTIYFVEAKIGKVQDWSGEEKVWVPSIQIKSVKPAILIQGLAIDKLLLSKPWEGTSSACGPNNVEGASYCEYQNGDRIPIRIRFTASSLEKKDNLLVWDPAAASQRLRDGAVYGFEGKIENFDKPLNLPGRTFPNLNGLGTRNPFVRNPDNRVYGYRFPAMHGAGDANFYFEWPIGGMREKWDGMGTVIPFSPAGLFQLKDNIFTQTSITAHAFLPELSLQLKLVDD